VFSEVWKVGHCRLEVGVSAGTGKLKHAGSIDSVMKESVNRAFAYLQGHKVPLGIGNAFDTTDLHVQAIDMLGNSIACEAGIAFLAAAVSALKRTPVLAGMVILGDLSIQGNIRAVLTLSEPLQIAMENGAKKALIPLENKRNFLEVPGDIAEKVDPVFFSDPTTAITKAIGLL